MRLMLASASLHHRLDRLDRVVAHVGALDDVDDHLGQVLRMVADALDRLGDEHEVDATRRWCADLPSCR